MKDVEDILRDFSDLQESFPRHAGSKTLKRIGIPVHGAQNFNLHLIFSYILCNF